MNMEDAIHNVQSVIALNMTDQDLAALCPTLSAEDIHTIRHTENIALLPFAAIQELSIVSYEQEKKHQLMSPIRQEEFHLFKERMNEALSQFAVFQQNKYMSDNSQMDDDAIACIVSKMYDEMIHNEEEMLHYFKDYQKQIEQI